MTTEKTGPRLLAALALTNLGPLFCASAQTTPQGPLRSALKEVLRKQRLVDHIRIEYRPGPRGANWRLKVQTAADKGIKVTVLYPVSEAGLVSLDDSKELKTFFPDSESLLVQPSPYRLQPSVDWRMRLIEKNYRLAWGANEIVAGQKTRELVLAPLRKELPLRRLFIDPSHDVVLKYLVDSEDGQTTVFETRTVIYGKEARRNFELPAAAASARVERGEAPRLLKKLSEARTDAGFTARAPAALPFGFRVSGVYLFGTGEKSYVGVKLSDGMASLNVFEWQKDRFRRVPAENVRKVGQDEYEIVYGVGTVAGDRLPDSVMEQILEAFVKKAE